MVEDSTYNDSAANTKNHKYRGGFTDYFINTVQIGGKVYDVNINIKKQFGSDSEYIYTLQLNENKKERISPVAGKTNMSSARTDTPEGGVSIATKNTFIDSISYNGENVNSKTQNDSAENSGDVGNTAAHSAADIASIDPQGGTVEIKGRSVSLESVRIQDSGLEYLVKTATRGENYINKIRTIYARRDFAKNISDKSVLYLNENKRETK